MQTVLVTGGLGYIGSHTCISLITSGYKFIIFDSLNSSSYESLKRISEFAIRFGKDPNEIFSFIKGDVRESNLLDKIFKKAEKNKTPIKKVIHFAGLKSVSESHENPINYWDVNVNGTINLLKTMFKNNCNEFIFSSSAAIYGSSHFGLINEDSLIKPENPYAETKAAVESILKASYNVNPHKLKIACLRYFNPIGAHPFGSIEENSNNIFPYLIKIASKKEKFLKVFGNDWPTFDGTGIRDYIHVMDLAEGHISAMKYLDLNKPQFINLNLGTGEGTSVMQLVKTFEEVNSCKINFKFEERRNGDVPSLIADNKKASFVLNWKPRRTLEKMCKDGWEWGKLYS